MMGRIECVGCGAQSYADRGTKVGCAKCVSALTAALDAAREQIARDAVSLSLANALIAELRSVMTPKRKDEE